MRSNRIVLAPSMFYPESTQSEDYYTEYTRVIYENEEMFNVWFILHIMADITGETGYTYSYLRDFDCLSGKIKRCYFAYFNK